MSEMQISVNINRQVINLLYENGWTKPIELIHGSIHGDPSTFGKEFFFWFFFDSICRRGLENTFDEKKLRAFLSKFARSRSFFRNVFGIARNTQKISGKSGDISKKIGPLYWNYRFLSHFLNKQQLEYTTVTELSFDTGNFLLWK